MLSYQFSRYTHSHATHSARKSGCQETISRWYLMLLSLPSCHAHVLMLKTHVAGEVSQLRTPLAPLLLPMRLPKGIPIRRLMRQVLETAHLAPIPRRIRIATLISRRLLLLLLGHLLRVVHRHRHRHHLVLRAAATAVLHLVESQHGILLHGLQHLLLVLLLLLLLPSFAFLLPLALAAFDFVDFASTKQEQSSARRFSERPTGR